MSRAEIATKQAVYTLKLLHAELAGKLLANKREAIRLRTAMMQVEAVMKMPETPQRRQSLVQAGHSI
jgi:hypothetical protein